MSRPAPLLAALALTWVVALGATEWLGLTALGMPRTEETPMRLMLRAADAESRAITLEAALVTADMATDSARWTLKRPESGRVRGAIELSSEDARNLDLLPAGFEIFRLGGEPALRLTMPDRGALTHQFVRPFAEARMDETIAVMGADLRERRARRDGTTVELWWVLAAHPRGEAAPDIKVPVLTAPQLPLRRDTTGR